LPEPPQTEASGTPDRQGAQPAKESVGASLSDAFFRSFDTPGFLKRLAEFDAQTKAKHRSIDQNNGNN